jgi:histone acetyltransferase (RNA polymerase elongator complex component)
VRPEEIPNLVEAFLSGCSSVHSRRRVLGFFGGSFTGIERPLLQAYLDVARDLVARGRIHAAKASTRPDMVSEDILDLLGRAGFEELEIGVQSMDDAVLEASMRGHTAADALRACELVRASGMRLGIQLMPGLPGEDEESFRRTVAAAVRMQPDTARIYPTVVLKGTLLERLYLQGGYRPLSLDEALRRTLFAVLSLEARGCTILRMGLPQSPSLEVAAGPFHECFGFLVRAHGYAMMAEKAVQRLGKGCELSVNPRDIPELVGYRGRTRDRLGFLYSFHETIPRGTIRARAASESTCIQLQDILEYIL